MERVGDEMETSEGVFVNLIQRDRTGRVRERRREHA